MSKLMLIDATHPEETRVAVVANGQIEDFDFEARNKRQLRGNIYLAKVTRVEPSLQAAFVDYGGNRHGFLAFSEIHPGTRYPRKTAKPCSRKLTRKMMANPPPMAMRKTMKRPRKKPSGSRTGATPSSSASTRSRKSSAAGR